MPFHRKKSKKIKFEGSFGKVGRPSSLEKKFLRQTIAQDKKFLKSLKVKLRPKLKREVKAEISDSQRRLKFLQKKKK